jgi:uncharacterized protein YfbU (UPF0304 family)
MMSLSDVERRILLNQYKILSALFPAEAEQYDRLAQILAEGYHDRWADAILGDMKEPLPREETDFVFDALVMFDWLQKSYYSLPRKERHGVDERRLRFPGFDAGQEGRLATYARFLVQRMERFAFLNAVAGMTSAAPMRMAYVRMLMALPKLEDRSLSAQEMRSILDAGARRPAPAPGSPLNRAARDAPASVGGSLPKAGRGPAPAQPATRGALALKSGAPAVLPHEVFEQTPELAAFEAALNATLAREAFPYFRE